MAQSDVNLLFSQAQQVTVSGPSTMTYDMAQGPVNSLSGTYQTNAAAGLPMTFGNAQFFGEDLGIGRLRLSLGCWVNVAYSGGTSLQISWQGAIDNGGGTIAGLTFVNYTSGPVYTPAQLGVGAILPLPDWPFDLPATNSNFTGTNQPPRFMRLFYTLVGPFTQGSLTAGVVNAMSYMRVGAYPSGFSVGP